MNKGKKVIDFGREREGGWMDEQMDGWMDGWMN